jgi:hypothetical protein
VYCVCFEVQTGKHLLGLNLSAFDPTETLAAPDGNALDTGFSPFKVLV